MTLKWYDQDLDKLWRSVGLLTTGLDGLLPRILLRSWRAQLQLFLTSDFTSFVNTAQPRCNRFGHASARSRRVSFTVSSLCFRFEDVSPRNCTEFRRHEDLLGLERTSSISFDFGHLKSRQSLEVNPKLRVEVALYNIRIIGTTCRKLTGRVYLQLILQLRFGSAPVVSQGLLRNSWQFLGLFPNIRISCTHPRNCHNFTNVRFLPPYRQLIGEVEKRDHSSPRNSWQHYTARRGARNVNVKCPRRVECSVTSRRSDIPERQ